VKDQAEAESSSWLARKILFSNLNIAGIARALHAPDAATRSARHGCSSVWLYARVFAWFSRQNCRRAVRAPAKAEEQL